jgi:hypothetical protein
MNGIEKILLMNLMSSVYKFQSILKCSIPTIISFLF